MAAEENQESAEKAPASATKATEPKKTPIGPCESIEEFAMQGLKECLEATKAIGAYPQGSGRDLYCSFPAFGKIIEQQSDRILGLISTVLKSQNIRGNIQRRQEDEQFEMLQECNDIILERVNSSLDEMTFVKNKPQPVIVESRLNNSRAVTYEGRGAGSWNMKRNEGKGMTACLTAAKNISPPQLKFKVPVDNRKSTPFVPKIKDKPNSLKPLAVLPEYDEAGNIVSYLHPYEFELMKFEVPEEMLQRRTPLKPVALSETPYMYVDTLAQLNQALEELRQHKIIGVDVEHHNYRSFLGMTCLVQISTRDKDYLFDALELREEMHILNNVFTDPKVIKVFHGADSDVEWLQRDLSLYIVNLFDTHQAAKVLNFSRLSLAYLMRHYCNIEADKTFQLADWRMRPLTPKLIEYARQDTHYLIYIFECMTNDVLDLAQHQTNLLRSVYQRSTEICKKRYVKPIVHEESHIDFYRKSKRLFDNRQMSCLSDLYYWRDGIARQEDESLFYVLPNHMLLQIAESLPREMQGILACCNPIPPLVKQNLQLLHQYVLRAREQPLVKPINEFDGANRSTRSATDFSNKLLCPHDLTHQEFRDDLPTLLRFDKDKIIVEAQEITAPAPCEPIVKIFGTTEPTEEEKENMRKRKSVQQKIVYNSPYQRYQIILPIAAEEQRQEAERLAEEYKKRQLCPSTSSPNTAIKHEAGSPGESGAQDDEYSLPIKDQLKRKYEKSVAKKAAVNVEIDSPPVKRIKTVTPNDDMLTFSGLPPPQKRAKLNKHQSQQQHPQQQKSFRQDRSKYTYTAPAAASVASTATTAAADDSDGPPDELPSTSGAHLQDHTLRPTRGETQHKNHKNKKGKKFEHGKVTKPIGAQTASVQKTFDYKNVDFKKFQGGAKHAKGIEIKPQFHGKGNSNKVNNKKFNKLFTFSNVKSNKK